MPKALDQDLAAIWQLRHEGRVEDAHDAYDDLCAALRVSPRTEPSSQLDALREGVSWSDEQILDFLLVEVSLRRRFGTREQYRERLREIDELMLRERFRPHFQHHFQTALNALEDTLYVEALESFLDARRYARDARERLYSWFNAILCMENLAYDHTADLTAFEQEYARSRDEPWAKAIHRELRALLIRHAFRSADFSALARLDAEPIEDLQSAYLLAWLAQLPTIATPLCATATTDRVRAIISRAKGYHSSYRLNTVTGILTTRDLERGARPSDQVERFYQWVWAWLLEPELNRLDKVLKLKNGIISSLGGLLTADDYRMLETGTRWLGLLLGLQDINLKASLSHLVYPSKLRGTPLEYEVIALDYFFARRANDDSATKAKIAELEAHPMHGKAGFVLSELVKAMIEGEAPPKTFAKVFASLEDLIATPPPPSNGLVIDLASGENQRFAGGAVVDVQRSHTLARLMNGFASSPSVHVADVLMTCYGIGKYDPVLHDGKIACLLSRCNRTWPDVVTVSRKGSFVFARFADVSIQFFRDNPHTRQLVQCCMTMDLLGSAPETELPKPIEAAAEVPPAARISQWLTRKDLESLTGMPRSTLMRQLGAWEREHLVERKGVGKASRYRLKPALQQKLSPTRMA